jgi:hypothetical protein
MVKTNIRRETGYGPSGYVVNSNTYSLIKKIEARRVALEEILDFTFKKKFVRRYIIRRMLGERPMHIIAPHTYYKFTRLRWRYIEWKYRNDPEWW